VFQKRYVVFGGWTGTSDSGKEVGAENDLWVLLVDLEAEEYYWKEYLLKDLPTPRDCHTATFTGAPLNEFSNISEHFRSNLLVTFGGTDPAFIYLNEISVLNVDGLWTPQKLTTLAMQCVIKNAKVIIAQHNGFEEFFSKIPQEIRDYIYHQLSFLHQKHTESPVHTQNFWQKTQQNINNVFYKNTESTHSPQLDPDPLKPTQNSDVEEVDTDEEEEDFRPPGEESVPLLDIEDRQRCWFCCCCGWDCWFCCCRKENDISYLRKMMAMLKKKDSDTIPLNDKK